jgi:hypothetical protein
VNDLIDVMLLLFFYFILCYFVILFYLILFYCRLNREWNND